LNHRILGLLIGALATTALSLAACGVRGRPQPPLTPAELGRGRPSFKRATENYAFPSVTPPDVSSRTARPSPTPPPDMFDNQEDDDQ